MHNFRNIRVWEFGMDIVDHAYHFTATLPEDERYGLKSQLNRCAVSIPANIAEGSGRDTNKGFAHFVSIAIGSSFEFETHLLICQRNRLGNQPQIESLLNLVHEEQKMLKAFRQQLL